MDRSQFTPEELAQADLNVFDYAQRLAEKIIRLEAMEQEYKHLLTLVELIVDRNFLEDSVQITISKKNLIDKYAWRDILVAAQMKGKEK